MTTKRQQQTKLIENLKKNCHFQKDEIAKLVMILSKQATNGKLDRAKFRDILHQQFDMTDELLMDRVFKVFDKDNDSFVSYEEWVRGMSVFLKGVMEEKTKYCFDVYDLNGDGFISREEMFQLLKTCLIRQPTEEDPDEQIKELVEVILKKMDHDHDNRVSYADFEKSVQEEPLLLEAFGPCLPCKKKKDVFMALFTDDSQNQSC